MQLSLLEQLPLVSELLSVHSQRLTGDDLSAYIPGPAIEYILKWFRANPVRLRIAAPRSSKFGDYRLPRDGKPATISVNNNLNRYDFLITLVHEMAHDAVFNSCSMAGEAGQYRKRRTRSKPHGQEWRNLFHHLMKPLMTPDVFPQEILAALHDYLGNPDSTVKASHALTLVLKKYDVPDGREFLQDLPHDAIFYLPGGRAFRKKEKIRKRFRCQSLTNRRIYLFNPLAPVLRNKP